MDPTQSEWIIDKREATADHGMVTAMHPLAAAAGLEILRAGGNAVDAAVATAFAIGVVEPFMSGVGGVTAMVIHSLPDGRTIVVDGSSRAPAAAYEDMFELAAADAVGGIYGWRATQRRRAEHRLPRAGRARSTSLFALRAGQVRQRQAEPRPGHGAGHPPRRGRLRGRPLPGPDDRVCPAAPARLPGDLPHVLPRRRHTAPAAIAQPRSRPASPSPTWPGRCASSPTRARTRCTRVRSAHDWSPTCRPTAAIISHDDLASFAVREFEPGVTLDYRGYQLFGLSRTSGSMTAFQALRILRNFDLRCHDARRKPPTSSPKRCAMPFSIASPTWPIRSCTTCPSMACSRTTTRRTSPARSTWTAPTPDARAGDPWRYQTVGAGARVCQPSMAGGDGCTTHLNVVDADRNAVALHLDAWRIVRLRRRRARHRASCSTTA